MAPPRVFFSFHYDRDIWRTNQVRNSWVTKGGAAHDRFEDASLWEEAKLRGDVAIQRLIDSALEDTDATVVLIGNETAERRWVRYEIQESWRRGNAIIGVQIHRLKDRNGKRDVQGLNPFSRVRYDGNKTLGQIVPIYHWQQDSGYENLVEWLANAPRREDVEGGITAGQAVAGVALFVGLAYLLRRFSR